MSRYIAFVWLVILGTNVAEYYSSALTAPVQGMLLLGGPIYFSLAYRQQLVRLLFFPDFLLVLVCLLTPALLMLLSDHFWERGVFTGTLGVAAAFVAAAILGARPDLNRTWAHAALTIVAVATALNLYELFVQNNVWSVSPGRSAGLYFNPNISAEALVGFGLVYLLVRPEKINGRDAIFVGLVLVAVFATFSRGGILGGLALLLTAAASRVDRKSWSRMAAAAIGVFLLVTAFGFFVVEKLELSEDAMVRILSLVEAGGVGDYRVDRGEAALAAIDIAAKNPVLGAGVGTVYEMSEGPHNMFLAALVDYGIVGLLIYLAMIAKLAMTARRADLMTSGVILWFVGWLIIFGFASHNLLGNAMTIPLLGLAVGRAYQISARAREVIRQPGLEPVRR